MTNKPKTDDEVLATRHLSTEATITIKARPYPTRDDLMETKHLYQRDVPFNERTKNAGWTNDPGAGKALLDEYGRETPSPLQFAPPIGFIETSPVRDMIQEMIAKELASLRGDEEIDSLEDAEDFGEDEEPEIRSAYEMVLEYPAIPQAGGPPNIPSSSPSPSEQPAPIPAAEAPKPPQ